MNVATKNVPTSNPYIYTKNVSVQNLYKVQTKNDLKLEICILYIEIMYKLYKTYGTS